VEAFSLLQTLPKAMIEFLEAHLFKKYMRFDIEAP
jgi:hypothetical protein